jgi:hypothetical protein
MTMRALVLVALLVPSAAGKDEDAPLSTNPAVAAHVLSSARKDLKTARDAFKALSPDERSVVKGARDTVAPTAQWRAIAPSFGAAADLLEKAGAGNGASAELCAHMARSFRAMADELDKDASYLSKELQETAPAERSAATFAAAEKLLAEAEAAELEEVGAAAWDLMKRRDPRYHALALNVRTLARGFATLREMEHDEAAGPVITSAGKLQTALAPCFAGVKTSVPEKPETPEKEPEGYGGGARRLN